MKSFIFFDIYGIAFHEFLNKHIINTPPQTVLRSKFRVKELVKVKI